MEARQQALRTLAPTWEPKVVDKEKEKRLAAIEALRQEQPQVLLDENQRRKVKQELDALQSEAEARMKRRIVLDYFS